MPPQTVGEPGSAIDPTRPTPAPPGSARKLRVMQARASRGLPLFHPDDNHTPALPRGVSWHEGSRRWRARLWDRATKRRIHVGLFRTPGEAAAAIEKEKARRRAFSPDRIPPG